jgi:hypothetical protein
MSEPNYNETIVVPLLQKKWQDLMNQNLILEVNLLIEQAKVQKLTKDLEKYDKKKKTDV